MRALGKRVYRKVSGVRIPPSPPRTVYYGNLPYTAGLPNLDGLGPLGDNLHRDRERVDLPSIVSRAQLAALFLHRLATGEIALPR